MAYNIDKNWDDTIGSLIVKEELVRKQEHESSGKISASMMAQPALDCVLKLLGVPGKGFDPYTLRKFARGNQVEDWFVHKVQQAFPDIAFGLQRKTEYRDGIGYQDLSEVSYRPDGYIPHEVKSVTNAKYKRISEGAWKTGPDGKKVKGQPEPDMGHVYQAAWYALAEGSPYFYIHYIAADDLRITTFKLETADYQEMIDTHINLITASLSIGLLPEYVPFLGWHGIPQYAAYPEFCGLSSAQAEALLKELHPEAYKKLREGKS